MIPSCVLCRFARQLNIFLFSPDPFVILFPLGGNVMKLANVQKTGGKREESPRMVGREKRGKNVSGVKEKAGFFRGLKISDRVSFDLSRAVSLPTRLLLWLPSRQKGRFKT